MLQLFLPDVHRQLLFGDESLAALRTDVLPALIALVGLLTEVETTPRQEINILLTSPVLSSHTNSNILSQLNQRKI